MIAAHHNFPQCVTALLQVRRGRPSSCTDAVYSLFLRPLAGSPPLPPTPSCPWRQAGAEVQRQDADGDTALHYACQTGHTPRGAGAPSQGQCPLLGHSPLFHELRALWDLKTSPDGTHRACVPATDGGMGRLIWEGVRSGRRSRGEGSPLLGFLPDRRWVIPPSPLAWPKKIFSRIPIFFRALCAEIPKNYHRCFNQIVHDNADVRKKSFLLFNV